MSSMNNKDRKTCCAGENCSPSSKPTSKERSCCDSKTSTDACDSKTVQSCGDKCLEKPISKIDSCNSKQKSCCKSDGIVPEQRSSCCAIKDIEGPSACCMQKESCCVDETNKTCSSSKDNQKDKEKSCSHEGKTLPSKKHMTESAENLSCCTGPGESCCGEKGSCCEDRSLCECETVTCCCGESCNVESCKCPLHLVHKIDPNNGSRRSTFYVEEICCATETAAIRSILGLLDGVANVRVNTTTKMLYVDHDLDKISAADICEALNRDRFGARVEKDAALETCAESSFVTSILAIIDQDIPDKDAIMEFFASRGSTVIQSATVDIRGKRITLVHNALIMPANQIVQALSDALAIKAKVLKDGEETLVWEFDNLVEEKNDNEVIEVASHSLLRPAVAVSGILWIVSMLSYIGGNWDYLKYVALLSVVFGLPPIAMKAVVSLRGCRLDINCLMTFAAIGALALQDFTEAAAVTFLFAVSEWLEVRATTRARNALSAILDLRPERANLIHPKTGEIILVSVAVVPVGALVSVRAGDKIPCDGVVVEGQSNVDESSLTGESRPTRKGPNDIVSGGTINAGNTQVTIRTTALAEDSAVARLIRLVEEAQVNRSETEKLVDDFARIYTPVIVTTAIVMCTIPWAWGHDVGVKWTELGLVLIVIACPCALIISTPVSYVAGLAATAQRGVLVKGGAHLEALGLVKTVCFDKTGTLTQGKFQLLQFAVIGEKFSRKETLEYLVMMEDRASHPLARALVEGAQKEGVKIPEGRFVRNHTFLPGEGVIGTIGGETVYVGNERLFRRLGLYATLPAVEQKTTEEWGKIGSVGFMSIGGQEIVCSYCVADAIRPESSKVLIELKELGVDTMMLTGDNHETAVAIGAAMGLAAKDIKSQLFPEEKLAIVSELKDGRSGSQSVLSNLCSKRRLVLMCGDGVNDAPALAAADVGVAVAGSALAMETADVTLMDSHLTKLVFAMKMGRRVIRKIKENVAFSLTVKFLVLGFALAGKAALWAAIASDVGAMLLVTLNSMMLLPSKYAHKETNNEIPTEQREEVLDIEK